MKEDISRLRQQIKEIEVSRADSVQAILQEQGPLCCGSLVTVIRRCGKMSCHCAAGQGHPTTYLSIKDKGKTRMVYIPADLLETVTRQAGSYRRIRKHRARLVKMAHESLQLIDRLQKALANAQPIGAEGEAAAGKKRRRKRNGSGHI